MLTAGHSIDEKEGVIYSHFEATGFHVQLQSVMILGQTPDQMTGSCCLCKASQSTTTRLGKDNKQSKDVLGRFCVGWHCTHLHSPSPPGAWPPWRASSFTSNCQFQAGLPLPRTQGVLNTCVPYRTSQYASICFMLDTFMPRYLTITAMPDSCMTQL